MDLLETLRQIPLVDHHAHSVLRAHPATLDEFRGLFSESADPRQWPHVATAVSYRRGIEQLARELGCEATQVDAVETGLLRIAIGLAAASADVVIAHVPRQLSSLTRWCVEQSDHVIEVVSLDVLSFRATSRALEVLSPLGVDRRVGVVVNRAARSEITPSDVRRVFDREPLVVVPFDGAVARLQDHGRLSPPRGRIGRAFDRLAGHVLETPTEAVEVAS